MIEVMGNLYSGLWTKRNPRKRIWGFKKIPDLRTDFGKMAEQGQRKFPGGENGK